MQGQKAGPVLTEGHGTLGLPVLEREGVQLRHGGLLFAAGPTHDSPPTAGTRLLRVMPHRPSHTGSTNPHAPAAFPIRPPTKHNRHFTHLTQDSIFKLSVAWQQPTPPQGHHMGCRVTSPPPRRKPTSSSAVDHWINGTGIVRIPPLPPRCNPPNVGVEAERSRQGKTSWVEKLGLLFQRI